MSKETQARLEARAQMRWVENEETKGAQSAAENATQETKQDRAD